MKVENADEGSDVQECKLDKRGECLSVTVKVGRKESLVMTGSYLNQSGETFLYLHHLTTINISISSVSRGKVIMPTTL